MATVLKNHMMPLHKQEQQMETQFSSNLPLSCLVSFFIHLFFVRRSVFILTCFPISSFCSAEWAKAKEGHATSDWRERRKGEMRRKERKKEKHATILAATLKSYPLITQLMYYLNLIIFDYLSILFQPFYTGLVSMPNWFRKFAFVTR